MNNQQFRRLVLDTPVRPQNGADSPPKAAAGSTPGSLGSRSRSSIPMTPRTVRGATNIDFARQLAERDGPATKKFRSSAAPKGTKLAAGYHDRTKDRVDDEADDKARRIKALEEQLKLDQIDQETFEKIRDEITGGDVSATHLVKGLDRKLLERVRRGENVMEEKPKVQADEHEGEEQKEEVDEEQEFEALEQKEVAPVAKEKVAKKGEMAPPPPIAGVKRSRNAILAELKASRKAAAEAAAAAQPQLGSKFRKISNEPRIEIDDRGREVLIVVGEDGKIKRKVRKVNGEKSATDPGLLEVDKDVKPLGIEESELPKAPTPPPPDDEDDDIFEGVGAEYDPLAGLGEEEADSSDEGEIEEGKERAGKTQEDETSRTDASAAPKPTTGPRNYFKDSGPSESVFDKPDNPLQDPAILAALRNASRKAESAESSADTPADPDEEARLKRRAAMLATSDRDMDDLDMGFGSSRFDDAEEGEDNDRVKLSQWKGTGAGDDDDEDGGDGRGAKKRKRGPKKRKGDKNSAADVMKVLEKRQGEK